MIAATAAAKRISWPAAMAATGLFGLVATWVYRPLLGEDTARLMHGTETIADCLRSVALVACDFEHVPDNKAQMGPIGPFPVLQYLPDLVAHLAGASFEHRARLLSLLSVAGLLAAIWAAWIVTTRLRVREWRWVVLLCIVTGPAIAYGSYAWGEMLALGLLTLFVAATLLPARPWIVAVTALGATLTKESNLPFVIGAGLLCFHVSRLRGGSPTRRHIGWGAGGIGVGLALASGLNVLRFGSVLNTNYLQSELRTPTTGRVGEFAAALVVAPNGGIVLFWPLATVVFAVLVAPPVWRLVMRRALPGESLVACGLVAITTGLMITLATWWSPFGWWAWGPRLSLPWVIPLLLIAIAAFGEETTARFGQLLQSWVAAALLVGASIVVALPHVGVLWRPQTVTAFFQATTSACHSLASPGSTEYYACVREQMWSRHPVLLDALDGLGSSSAVLTLAMVSLAVVGTVTLLRRELLERSP